MPIRIYKSLKKAGTYVYLPAQDAPERLPDTLRRQLGPWEFVLALTLTPQSRLATEDPAQVLAQLAAQGYHLQWPPLHTGAVQPPGQPHA